MFNQCTYAVCVMNGALTICIEHICTVYVNSQNTLLHQCLLYIAHKEYLAG